MHTMYKGNRYTAGYKAIMHTVRLQDFDDPWGTALANLFGLATVAWVEYGEIMPEFSPSPVESEGSDLEDWPDAEYQEMYRDGVITREDIEAAYRVLNRYADLVPEDLRY